MTDENKARIEELRTQIDQWALKGQQACQRHDMATAVAMAKRCNEAVAEILKLDSEATGPWGHKLADLKTRGDKLLSRAETEFFPPH